MFVRASSFSSWMSCGVHLFQNCLADVLRRLRIEFLSRSSSSFHLADRLLPFVLYHLMSFKKTKLYSLEGYRDLCISRLTKGGLARLIWTHSRPTCPAWENPFAQQCTLA